MSPRPRRPPSRPPRRRPPEAPAAEATATPSDAAAKPEPESTPPPPSGHAVARIGALVFTSSTGGVGFEIPPLGEGTTAPAGVTFNVVGERDGRLEVENLVGSQSDPHCAGAFSGLADFRLKLFVSRDDLLPVLVEEITEEFGDDTSLRVARGVPVASAESKTLVVNGLSVHLTVPDPEKTLGRFYAPGHTFSSDESEGLVYEVEGQALTYDGTRSLVETSLFRDGSALVHFGAITRGSEALVTVRNACLEAKVLTSAERLEIPSESALKSAGVIGALEEDGGGHFLASPYGGAFAVGNDDEDVWGGLTATEIGETYGVGGLGLVGSGSGRMEYTVTEGTAIVWPDGRPAGQVTSEHTFEEAPREEGGHSCFTVPLTKEPAPTIQLCFAPGDVSEEGSGTIGLGSTGLIGKGGGGKGSGYGRGSGAGFGGRGKKVPRVRQAKATVKGSLDKDIIRRIVRAHINEVRSCYNAGLLKDPSLSGKVSVQFTIAPTGKVAVAVVSSSTVSDKDVGNCIAKAVKRWKFPKPAGGGNVVVTYPFVLAPG